MSEVMDVKDNESIVLVSELIEGLSQRFKSDNVWYQVSDSELPIYFVGHESLVYYKVQDGEIVWSSFY